jgi:hypothetical protein
VHDAANCLRRFLNYLPEPVILFSLYEPFRQVAASDHDSCEYYPQNDLTYRLTVD